jgi:hypothetical protein
VFRRLFTIASAVSLLMCAATVVFLVRSYRGRTWDMEIAGNFMAISNDGALSVCHMVPDGVTQMDFHYWKWALLLAILPVLWLVLCLIRRRPSAGQCTLCGYDLTGNTSGVCPECGTPVMSTFV